LHLEGLLHLSAIAVAISAVYIGLDRIHSEPDRFRKQLRTVQGRVRRSLLRLDVLRSGPETRPKLKKLFDEPSVHLLCYVAGINIELGAARRLLHFLHRQPFVPLVGIRRWCLRFAYYRRRFSLFLLQ